MMRLLGSASWLRRNRSCWLILALVLIGAGCHHLLPPPVNVPNENAKMALPPYVIEPPDVLEIDAVRLVPRPPYSINPLDILVVQFPANEQGLKKDDYETLFLAGRVLARTQVTVAPDGTINLGPTYGKVTVTDMTVEQASKAVEARIRQFVKKEFVDDGKVNLDIVQPRGMQLVLGPHLVRPDGTVGLGTYGSVFVTGMTLDEAREVLQEHLSKFVVKPQISLDVIGFNSKVYYILFDRAGFGETVIRIPSYGNETVLDALSNVFGLSAYASRARIWIARPSREEGHADQIIPVDWGAITKGGAARGNYQVFPGDRIYVQAKPIIAFDNYLSMFLNPAQRIMGAITLGVGTYNALLFAGQNGGIGSPGGFTGR